MSRRAALALVACLSAFAACLSPFAGCLSAFAAWPALAADGDTWRVAGGEVRVVCPLTVGGSFEAKTAALGGTLVLLAPRPPRFEGALEVSLETVDTGIGLRNDHLRNRYLEVGRGDGFDKAVLSDIRLGDVDAASFEGRTTFDGQFRLHGATAAVRGSAVLRRVEGGVRVEAAFDVVLADFGIEKPRYLGVGVKDVVQVKASLFAAAAR